jgi:hypothetical protein
MPIFKRRPWKCIAMSANDEPNLVDAAPTRVVRKMVNMTLHWYLPGSQEVRFHELGYSYGNLDLQQWESGFQMTRIKLNKAIAELRTWQERTHTDELISSWDDEVFFFYILHFQFLWVRLHTLEEEQMIPWGEDFWDWGMVVRDEIPCIAYTFPTVAPFMNMSPRPYVWGFYAPSDVTIPTLGEQGITLDR